MVSFPTTTLYTPPPHTRYMPHTPHSSWFYHSHNNGWAVQIISSSLCCFLHSPVTPSLLGPNILNTLWSNTLSLRSSLNVNDQVSHTYQTTGKIIVLFILIFKVLDSKLEDKRFCTEWWQALPDFKLLLISSWIEFSVVKFVPIYLNFFTLSKEINFHTVASSCILISIHDHVLSFICIYF